MMWPVLKITEPLRQRFHTWALRRNTPALGKITLVQHSIYVLPTRAGVGFAFCLLVMLIASINYNLSLGWMLVFLLTGLAISSVYHAFRNMQGLTIAQGRSVPVFAGEIAHFDLNLINTRQDERSRIRLKLNADSGEEEIVDLPPHSAQTVRLGVLAHQRGWLALPRLTLDTHWPLGLVRVWSYCMPAMQCLIYPQPASDCPPLPTEGGHIGISLHEQQGNEDFAGLRRHHTGDSPRQVAWKASARREQHLPLLTKEFSGTSGHKIWLDWQEIPTVHPIERRLSIMARWILNAETQGYEWGLRLPNMTLQPARGQPQMHAGLKALALYE